ncbi:MAG: hypothetical protein LC667_11475 [Thioalkalivibrio sp.]|nr:hypothetical protein [Thioalkalivibrio sp.]
MKSSWRNLLLLLLVSGGLATDAASSEMVGYWSCPTKLQLAAVGQSELTLQLNTRAHLRPEGRYESEGDAIVRLGRWPLTLAATSRGQWLREQQDVTVTVETLELSPGSALGVELQRYLIQQITSLFPELPHTQTTRILAETPTQLVLEDAFGEQYTCSRL